jgi:hypothetical protein
MCVRASDTVNLETVGFENVQATLAGELDDFARTVVGFETCSNIEFLRRNANAECFEHGIAADNEIIGIGSEFGDATLCSEARVRNESAFLGLLLPVSPVINAIFRLRGRTVSFESSAVFAA